jgi:TatD DNase family protein
MNDIRLIDAHAHVNFNAYKDDAEEVIARANEASIGMLVVGSQHSTSERAVKYAETHEHMWAVVGLHPTHLHEQHVDEEEIEYRSRAETFDRATYEKLATSKKVVAIGECGLDWYRIPEGADLEQVKEAQKTAFRAQVELAIDLDLPVMIHCRDAHDDVAGILEAFIRQGKRPRGNVHCFTGTWAEAERYLKIGFYISFTGIITFPPRKAEIERGESLHDVVKKVPIEKILVETDAPYLAPIPFRGKRNEPLYVRHVAEKIAELKGLDPDEVARQTLENTKKLFRLE